MKVAIALLLLVAAVYASDFENKAREGFVNAVNAARQRRVNHIAEAIGASSGTAAKDDVPGAGYPYYYGYPYGAAGYPYGGHYGYPYGGFPYGYYW